MSECNVCLEAEGIDRYFMPCGCRNRLCETCVKKVATQPRCLWCRAPPADETLNSAEMLETAAVLAASHATIHGLHQKIHDVQWQNTLLRVEMYHFKRHEFYRVTGFWTGMLSGLGIVLYAGLFAHIGLVVLVTML
jgi:hypothetical protein